MNDIDYKKSLNYYKNKIDDITDIVIKLKSSIKEKKGTNIIIEKKNNDSIFVNIFFGILIILSLIFLYYVNKNNDKKEEKSDENLKCFNGFCFKTL